MQVRIEVIMTRVVDWQTFGITISETTSKYFEMEAFDCV